MSNLQTQSTTDKFFSKENPEVLKGINLMGLNISGEELTVLMQGYTVSLENRSLSEIGSIFIFAEALSSLNSFKESTFQDLLNVCKELSTHPGLPIHCWTSDLSGKCCLLLAVVNCKLVLKAEFERCSIASLQTIAVS